MTPVLQERRELERRRRKEKEMIRRGDSQVSMGWSVSRWRCSLEPVLLHKAEDLSSKLWFPLPLCPLGASWSVGSVQSLSLCILIFREGLWMR